MSPNFQIRLLALSLLGTSFLGCNWRHPPVVPVSGTLMCNGHPVANLEVSFIPRKGPSSAARSDSTGRFKLVVTKDQDGAVVGTHSVFVAYNPPDETDFPAPSNLDEILAKHSTQGTAPIQVVISQAVDNLEIKLD